MIQTEYLPPTELHQLTGYILMQNSPMISKWDDHPSASYGVYALFDKDDGLLYIGKTLSLNLRINSHHWARVHDFAFYSAIEVPVDQMKQIEIAHIYALRPPGNKLYERISTEDNPNHGEMVTSIRAAWGLPEDYLDE